MKIKMMETGEIRELTLIDKETGEDIAGTVIAYKQYNNPTAIYCYNSDCYIMDEEDFEYFDNYFDSYYYDDIEEDIAIIESDILYEMSGMPCKIYGSWEIKELSYCNDDGIEMVFDIIGNSGAIGNEITLNRDNGFYYMSIDDFNFWNNYLTDMREDEEELKALKVKCGDKYCDYLQEAVKEAKEYLCLTVTYETQHKIMQEIIKHIKEDINND